MFCVCFEVFILYLRGVFFLLYCIFVLKFVFCCIGGFGGVVVLFLDVGLFLGMWKFCDCMFFVMGGEVCSVEFKSFEYFLSFCKSFLIDLILLFILF